MGTTAYGGRGSKGRAVSGDRPIGTASCRPKHTSSPPPPAGEGGAAQPGPSFPPPRFTWARSISTKSDEMYAPPPR